MNTGTGHDFASLLHAFALGCLEREDYDQMMDYFKSNQDYPWQELGEYQNLVALLPSFLDIEVPDSRVKDMVARKLYRLRDQQRPQRSTQVISQTPSEQHKNLFQRIETPEQKLFSQISSPLSPEEMLESETSLPDQSFESPAAAKSSKTMDFEPVKSGKEDYASQPEKEKSAVEDYSSPFGDDALTKDDDPFTNYSSSTSDTTETTFSSNFDEMESGSKEAEEQKDEFSFESSLSTYSVSGETSAKRDDEFSSFTSETIVEEPEAGVERETHVVQKTSSGVSSVVFALTFIVLAGTIAAVYYYLSKDFRSATDKQTAKYETIVQSLKTELSSTKELDVLLASINFQSVNLKSTPKAAGAYGKLMFDSVSRKAMLQVVNLPVLSSDKVYQLWIISNNQKYSAGIYAPSSVQKYFPVSNFSDLNLVGLTTFLVTEEISTGGEKPSKDVYLIGQIVF